ncbi:MAG: DUF2065 domain-containing protein [Phreatobacter sp.]|uniref:DUF2065 domain-containing protein n=1 Tax=Phreatobacter sp. TaxID=1966341 RepID=UPI001A54970E|nr:DUF2065 domain-containing protein [Phreatobacter sp.]MBL8569168.1 DUF2065 domain-containing protein [Phreatobacter sp.]MCA0320590.1 DUF2065 domain-containing protein [Pseudomonadota bacterium]
MKDLIVAIGLVLVIEGLILAAFPNRVRDALETMRLTPDQQLRIVGLIAAVAGLAVIWWMRG